MSAPALERFHEAGRHIAACDWARAEQALREALRLQPALAEAWANLGYVREQRGDADGALAGYRQALALSPGIAQVHGNLGACLARGKQFDAAEAAYREALVLAPNDRAAWSNLGVLLACVGREAQSEACHRRAIALDGADRVARFNLAYLLLRQGRYEEGWQCLEARAQRHPHAGVMPCPRWPGGPPAGRRLLICYEAGHGDLIQFCRYAPLLKARGAARIGLVCHPALKPLLASLEGVDELAGLDEPLPPGPWDGWVPALSLPYHCATGLDSIPARIPYLRADAQRVARWAGRIPGGGLRVGLVWQGNPRFENDADRSLPSLDVLAPLWEVAGVRFVSLQKRADGAAPGNAPSLLDLGPDLADFADTAAVLMLLDLVICVDTAVAHLAGALGRPCWVMLPAYKPDWRWLSGREDSPWYPGVLRLFRQPSMGRWEPVVVRVAEALRAYASRLPGA